MKLSIPTYAENVINVLLNNGYSAYFVGGAVRDSLLGNTPLDWDVTTSATPDQVMSLFPRHFETGIKHGTVTVLWDNKPVEITTFRVDSDYSDNRHPEQVVFAKNFAEDVKRRDFTVNAIGYNHNEGIVDLVGGQEDLKAGIIRCVGNPDTRFKEDALRILRGIRLASVLDFQFEQNTKEALINNKHLLKNISSERIRAEMDKMLMSDRSLKPLYDVCDVLFPELYACFSCEQNNKHHIYDVGTHSLKAAQYANGDIAVKYAALFHDIGKPAVLSTDEEGVDHFYNHELFSEEMAHEIFNRLKLDNKTKKEALMLIKYHSRLIEPTEKSVKKFLSKTSEEFLRKHLALRRADVLAQNSQYSAPKLQQINEIEEVLENVLASADAFSLKDLAVNGKDIMELGAKNSQIRFILNRLLTAVIDNQQLNTKEKLIEMAKNILNCR
ncbi:MAG: HD domain-containing protein [Clostridia bacterium]|nr:HD domain-containing protein [Clostridia bacterium]